MSEKSGNSVEGTLKIKVLRVFCCTKAHIARVGNVMISLSEKVCALQKGGKNESDTGSIADDSAEP